MDEKKAAIGGLRVFSDFFIISFVALEPKKFVNFEKIPHET